MLLLVVVFQRMDPNATSDDAPSSPSNKLNFPLPIWCWVDAHVRWSLPLFLPLLVVEVVAKKGTESLSIS